MKSKDTATLVVIGVISAFIAYIVAGVVFHANSKTEKVPTVQVINATFPDVLNESDYRVIFNDKSLDPTQPIQIQGNNNTHPFVSN